MAAWDFACPTWWEKLQRGETPIADLPLDDAEAQKAVQLFDALRVPDIPDTPAFRDAGGDWIRDIVAAIFGSMDPETGRRRVGEVFVLVPKKNAKTTSAAGIALTYMLRNKRPRADMLIVAPTQKIAETAFNQAAGMIECGLDIPGVERDWLQNRLHVIHHRSKIECQVTKSKLEVKTFATDILTGSKPVFVLVDETHELGWKAAAPKIYRQLRGGLTAPEACFVQITTQSDGKPEGVFREELQYARKVRDGTAKGDIRMLPCLYEFPEDVQTSESKDWLNPALWPAVTPNLGRSITIEKLKGDLDQALEKGTEELIGWATQHLNVEVGLALHANRWRGADYWLAQGRDDLTLDRLIETSEVAVVGVDGGGLDDLFGLAVIGRHTETKRWQHWAHAWAHTDVLKQRKEIVPILERLEKEGQVTICESPTEDVIGVADYVEQIALAGLLPEKNAIGLDPAGISALLDELALRDIEDEQMIAVGQGYRLSPAIWGLERKLKDGTFVHGGQDLMTWCVGNAASEQKGSAVLITKEVAGKAKIDPLIATFNAFQLMSRNPVAARPMDMDDFLANPVMVI